MQSFDLLVIFDDDSKETAEVYVEGKIQGEICNFHLDTGCSKTSLNFDDFTSQFEKINAQESSGILGRTEYDLIKVNSIELGTIIKNNAILSRAKKGELDRKLFGMDILKDYCLLFFFNDRKVEVWPKSPNITIESQDLILDKGFIPYVEFNFGNTIVRAVWDTGASATIVDMNVIKKNPSMFKQVGSEVGTDSTGSKMETPTYIMEPISLGGKIFPAHKVVGVDLSQVNAKIDIPMDFVLGFSTLKKANWLFNFPKKKWAIINMLDL